MEQGIAAGVVKKVTITPPKNPNKWGKTLAPWYNDTCREAKKELANTIREHGKGDARVQVATRKYLTACL